MGVTHASDSVGYMAFVRAAQVSSFLASAFVVIANVWMIVQLSGSVNGVNDVMSIVVRLYNILLGMLIIASLFDITFIAVNAYFLFTYFGLGMFQMFIGVLTLGSAGTYSMVQRAAGSGNLELMDNVRLISGWILMAVGALYILMGIFQFPHLSQRRKFMQISRSSLASTSAV